MKINFIMPSARLSGGVRMIFLYANALTEKGHDVACYFPLFGSYRGWKRILFLKSLVGYALHPEWRGEWFPDKKFKIYTPLYICNYTVRDADVTIATFWLTAYWVQRLSKGRKVYFIQGYEDWEKRRTKISGKNSYKLKFDLAITVSSTLKKRVLEEAGLESVLVCNGISRQELGLNIKKGIDGEIYIGFPYRDGKNKNCDTAINVLKKISDTEQIKIVAYGIKKPEIWMDEWDFLENPTREELYNYYEKIDIFYVPSEYEGWGLPAMEAMGHGVAVLAGDSGVIAEFGIDDINCKVLRNPLDVDEAVSKITELIHDSEKRKEIGTRAYDVICSEYTFEKSCEKFEKSLLSIL